MFDASNYQDLVERVKIGFPVLVAAHSIGPDSSGFNLSKALFDANDQSHSCRSPRLSGTLKQSPIRAQRVGDFLALVTSLGNFPGSPCTVEDGSLRLAILIGTITQGGDGDQIYHAQLLEEVGLRAAN